MATQEKTPPPPRDARAGGVLDGELQMQVAELNLRGIEVIRGALAGAAAGAGGGPDGGVGWGGIEAGVALPAALRQRAAQWLALDEAAQARLAASPYLLFELNFAAALRAGSAAPLAVQDARGPAGAAVGAVSPFASAAGRAFARGAFHYAWHLVRSAPTAAGFVLGVPRALLEPLRASGLPRVEAMAEGAGSWVRLRWDEEPRVWAAWLAAAVSGDPAASWAARLRGLQRIAGTCREVLPPG